MADTWDLMQHWNLVLPPSRPALWQLNRIAKVIRRIDRKLPVAVLGSTPEFRDLLHESGFNDIHVFDRNEQFYKAMSLARIYKNAETFIKGDWLATLSDFAGRFSVILSDLTSGNIPYSDRREFYKLVAGSLMKRGLFIDKVLTHPIPHMSIDRLMGKYSKTPLNLEHINHFSCEMLFCSKLLDIDDIVDSSAFYKLLYKKADNPRILAFINHAHKITPANCRWWYGVKWKNLLPDYCQNLDILTIQDEPASPYFRRAKLFVNTRNK